MKYRLQINAGTFPHTTQFRMETQAIRGTYATVRIVVNNGDHVHGDHIIRKLRHQLAVHLWDSRKAPK